jgi:outer membrane protein assembly factor BamB
LNTQNSSLTLPSKICDLDAKNSVLSSLVNRLGINIEEKESYMKISIKTFFIFSSILTIGAMLFLAGCSGSKNTTVVQVVQGASPVIQSLSIQGLPLAPGGTITATVVAGSAQNLALTYTWTVSPSSEWKIAYGGSTPTATITAPSGYSMTGTATVEVSDSYGRYALVPIPLSTVGNSAPVITGFSASPNPVPRNDLMALSVTATAPDGDTLSYAWQASQGWTIATGQGTSGITITAPDQYGVSGTVTVTVDDGYGSPVSLSIPVSTYFSSLPVITGLSISPQPVITSATLLGSAYGPQGDPLSYTWTVGGVPMFTGTTAVWDSPGIPGNCTVSLSVSVADGGTSISSTNMSISSTSVWPTFQRDLQSTGQSPVDTSSTTGALKWLFTTSNSVNAPPVIGSDDTIYVVSWDRNLYALYTTATTLMGVPTAALKWSFPTVCGAPAIGSDGTIYVGGMNGLYALYTTATTLMGVPTAALKWTAPGASGACTAPAIGVDGTIYNGGNNNFYALNPTDGTVKWSYPTGYIETAPAIGIDGTIYTEASGILCAFTPTGGLEWTYPTNNGFGSPAIGADGTIYIPGCSGVCALTPTGGLEWSYTTSAPVEGSIAIGADGTLYFGTFVGGSQVYALYTTATTSMGVPTAALKWLHTIAAMQTSPVIGADGTIYIVSWLGNLYALKPTDGTTRWTYSTGQGSAGVSSPVIGADGTIYFGSNNGKLYAIH